MHVYLCTYMPACMQYIYIYIYIYIYSYFLVQTCRVTSLHRCYSLRHSSSFIDANRGYVGLGSNIMFPNKEMLRYSATSHSAYISAHLYMYVCSGVGSQAEKGKAALGRSRGGHHVPERMSAGWLCPCTCVCVCMYVWFKLNGIY
jgi:hypothetical protein